MKIFQVIGISISALLCGCVSQTGPDFQKVADVSAPVVLPTTLEQSKPYIRVGLITIKGSLPVEEREIVRRLEAGHLIGRGFVTPAVYLDSNLSGNYSKWDDVAVLSGAKTTTQGGKVVDVVPEFRNDTQGIAVNVASRAGEQLLVSISAKVPTWVETRPVKGHVVPITWTLENFGAVIDMKSGWHVVRNAPSPDGRRTGRELVVIYVNSPLRR